MAAKPVTYSVIPAEAGGWRSNAQVLNRTRSKILRQLRSVWFSNKSDAVSNARSAARAAGAKVRIFKGKHPHPVKGRNTMGRITRSGGRRRI